MSQPQALGSTQKANVMLTFGVISVNVSVHSSVAEAKDASLKMVCNGPHGVQEIAATSKSGPTIPAQSTTSVLITRPSVCPICKSDEHVGRAKPVADGLVPIPTDVLEAAEAADKEFGREIALRPHPAVEVEGLTRPTGSRYYLNVKGGVSANYALLRQVVIDNPGTAFMTQFSLKGAAVPYRLVLDGDTLMLVQLADPENVRMRPSVTGDVNPLYLELANQLVQQTTTAYNPGDYLRPKTQILNAYVEGKVPTQPAFTGTTAVTGQVTDLFEALRASVAATAPKHKAAPKKSAVRKSTPKRKVS